MPAEETKKSINDMSRYLGPKHKLCRREGVKLCDSPKCPLSRRNYPPGVHGVKGYKRLTPYGEQLREKQKARRLYGIQEKQFRNYFNKAVRIKGDTGAFIIQMLEKRLDNCIYKAGFAKTRAQARQMVSHRFFLINEHIVNIPSYEMKPRDIITLNPNKAQSKLFSDLDKRLQNHEFPSWTFFDQNTKSLKIISDPKLDEKAQIFNIRSIVEFYSR